MIPQGVVHIRNRLCAACGELAADPCAACSHGKWGRYSQRGCENADRGLRIAELKKGKAQPGDLLAKIIHQVTGATPCGMCSARVAEMNRRGWWWCWRNRATIIGWLSDEARKRGHAIDDATLGSLFKAAIKELRK